MAVNDETSNADCMFLYDVQLFMFFVNIQLMFFSEDLARLGSAVNIAVE